MSDPTLISAKLTLAKARLEILKAIYSRWPAGAPSAKGGQFAPKGQTGGGLVAPQYGIGSKSPSFWSPSAGFATSAGSGQWSKPLAPPPGAKPHPKVDDKGQPVTINYPSKASPASTWSNKDAVATFTPGSNTPAVLNGVAFKSWSPPKDGWAAVTGTNEKLEQDFPFEPHPTKKSGAGVIVVEPDGRIWLTRPTNAFGGYQNTYPKGTVESGLTMQQNAIKEVWEETGLKVKIVGVLGDYERDTSKARFYIARRTTGTPKDMGWESQAVRLAPEKLARELLNREHDKQILEHAYFELGFTKGKSGPTKAESTGKPGHWQFQERWPQGSALGGQWKAIGADGITAPPKIAGGLTGSNIIYQKVSNIVHTAAQTGDFVPADMAIAKYVDAGNKFFAGVKSSHVKWGAQVLQYATQVKADLKAKASAVASADKIQGPQKLSVMTPVGGKPGGSNPGGMYTDSEGKWLVKGSNAADATPRSQNEVLASKLMQAAGVGAPDMKLVDLEGKHGGGIGVASKWVDGATAFNANNPAHVAAAQADFVVHAWLANYDVLGMGMDNTVILGGNAINIDPGGALLYRAQGAPKGDKFSDKATEFDSLRDPAINPNGAKVYGSMTASQLAASAERLKDIDEATIGKLVQTYGPGTDAEKADLAVKLLARKIDILAKVEALTGSPAPAPAMPAAAANPTAPTAAVISGNNPAADGYLPTSVWVNQLKDAGISIGAGKLVDVWQMGKQVKAFKYPYTGFNGGIKQEGVIYGNKNGEVHKDIIAAIISSAKAPKPDLNATNAAMLGGGVAAPAVAPAPAVSNVSAPATFAPPQTHIAAAQKLEMIDNKSDKFWQVATVGSFVVTQWGKNGTKGQQTFKDMGSPSAAYNEKHKLISEKYKKGYQNAGIVDMKVLLPATASTPAPAAQPAAPAPAPAAPPVSVPAFSGPKASNFKAIAESLVTMSAAELKTAKLFTANGKQMKIKTPAGEMTLNVPPKTDDGKKLSWFHSKLTNDKLIAAQAATAAPQVQAAPTSVPAAAPAAASASFVQKPTGWPSKLGLTYYTNTANAVESLHANGDIGALKALYADAQNKMTASQNAAKLSKYFEAAITDLEKKNASAVMQAVQTAQATISQPASAAPRGGTQVGSGPAMPSFEKFKLPDTNSNAPSHNAKIDLISNLASKGDIKGLVSLSYSTNTYGKMQAKLANDALTAAGYTGPPVVAGQKKNAHPSLTAGYSQADIAAAAATTKTALPPKSPASQAPDMSKLDVSKAVFVDKPDKFTASSKTWVNDQNNNLASAIQSIAQSGDLTALKSMTYEVIDKDTGVATGLFKPLAQHPSKVVTGYYDSVKQTLDEIAHPPRPLKTFDVTQAGSIAAITASMPGHKLGTTASKVAKNEQIGFFMALGKIAGAEAFAPKTVIAVSTAEISAAKTKYYGMSIDAQEFISGVQGNSLPSQYRQGFDDPTTSQAKKLTKYANEALKYATTKPAGTIIYKNIDMSKDMVQKLVAAGAGTVLQCDSPMCATYKKNNASTQGFGKHVIEFVYAPGAKAIDSHGSGAYSSEKEITVLPMARFMLLKTEYEPDPKHGGERLRARVLLLPPEPPGYL